jgi:membrane fusion protein, heavy metal efflux system
VDPDSQTVMLRALIDRNARNLRPGQNVEVTVAGVAEGGEAWRVPRDAVVRHEGRALVFMRVRDGFQPLAVSVLHEAGDNYTIGAALPQRAQIAVTGAAGLKAKLMGIGTQQ